MANEHEVTAVRPKEFKNILVATMKYNLECGERNAPAEDYEVPIVDGVPGIAKSALVNSASKECGLDYGAPVLPATRDPAELAGYLRPDPAKDAMSRYAPDWMPRNDERRNVFFDEIGQAAQSQQNVLCEPVLDRRCGGYAMSRFSTVIMAYNPVSSRAGSQAIVRQLLGRGTKYRLLSSAKDWVEWALETGIDPLVVNFIQWKGDEVLSNFDPAREINPSPRNWVSVANQRKMGLSADLLFKAAAGRIGAGLANEFVAFERLLSKMVHPSDIIASPTTAPVPQRQEEIFALCSALPAHATTKSLPALIKYCERIERREMQVFAVRSMLAKNLRERKAAEKAGVAKDQLPTDWRMAVPEVGAWLRANQSVLL